MKTFTQLASLSFAGRMEIDIEDVNDNAPQFILSDSVFGECVFEVLLYI